MELVEPKALWASITVWLNAVFGGLILALPLLESALPMLRDALTPEVYSWVVLFVVVVNILLRVFKTKAPVRMPWSPSPN